MSNNNINVVGNLVEDPNLRYTTSGKPVVNMRLAVNERTPDGNGGWKDRTTFVNVVCWDQQAENIAACASKGDRLMVDGRLNIREYEATEGTKTWFTEIVAAEVGVALRWATVDSIDRTTSNRQPAPVGAGAPAGDTAIYGDEEPF